MKNLLATILFLFSICAFGQSQGVSQRATNGISYGEMLVTGHINATNTSQTNTLAGKFQQGTGKATALGASAFGNNTIASGQYSVAIGSRGQNGGTSALSAGTSNTITSGGLNSFAVGAGNFISGSVSTAIGTNNFIEGYNNFGLGDSHQIDGSAGPDINNHIFLIGQSIDIPSPSAEVSSNLVVLNADPAGYTLIPPQSNSIYLNAPGGVFVNGSAISANLNPAALTNSDTRNIQFLGTFTRSNSANGNYASITDGQLAIGTTNQGRVVYFSQISTGLQIKADSGIVTVSTNGNIYGSAFHGSDVVVAGVIVAGGGVTLTGIAGTRSNAAVYLDSDAKLTGIAGANNGSVLLSSNGVPAWGNNGIGLTNLNASNLASGTASEAVLPYYTVSALVKWGTISATVTNLARSNNVATAITDVPHGMIAGQKFYITASSNTTFSILSGYGTNGIVIAAPTTTTFTYSNSTSTNVTAARDYAPISSWEILNTGTHVSLHSCAISAIASNGITVAWSGFSPTAVRFATLGQHAGDNNGNYTPQFSGVGLNNCTLQLRAKKVLNGRISYNGSSADPTLSGSWTKQGDTTSATMALPTVNALFVGHSSTLEAISATSDPTRYPAINITSCGTAARIVLPDYTASPFTSAGYWPSATGFYCQILNPTNSTVMDTTNVATLPAGGVQFLWSSVQDNILVDHTLPLQAVLFWFEIGLTL